MLTTYASLKTAIAGKLSAIETAEDVTLFSGVYTVVETTPAGYPCAFVVEYAGDGSIIDTHRNEREWQFEVTIMQEIGVKTPENAQTALLDAVDRVITVFDNDPYLADENGDPQVLWLEVVPLEFEYATGAGAVQTAKLRVACKNLTNRYATT